jgi:hypothetical protein
MTRNILTIYTTLFLLLPGITRAQAGDTTHKTCIVPARIAFIPGLGSQGKKDNYTSSYFSLNILGGSTGSVQGIEMGSLFNIDKKDMRGVQAAGLFNTTGGLMTGVQMAGLFNTTAGTVNGVQTAGLLNTTKKSVTGVQMSGLTNYAGGFVYGLQTAGLYNQASGNITGVQLGGIGNYTRASFRGIQIAGIANINNDALTGLQMAGIFNYTKHLKGLQLGLINIADTSDGYSIGLITIVRKGYHKISVSTNEVLNTNVAIKLGNAKLYNILMVGVNAGKDDKSFSYGYGIGHEIKLGSRFTVNPELTTQYLYLGSWHHTNILNKLQLVASMQLLPHVALFAGPSFSVYYSNQTDAVKGYKFRVPSENYHTFNMGSDKVTGWIGWTAGINFL